MMEIVNRILEYYPLQFRAAFYDDGSVWFSSSEYNGLFKLDLNSLTVRYLGMFPQEYKNSSWMHSSIIKVEDTLVFIPWSSAYITEYRIHERIFESYSLWVYDKLAPPYWGSVRWNQYIYFWTTAKEGVYRYDFERKAVEKAKCLKHRPTNMRGIEQWQSYSVAGDKIYIAPIESNRVVVIDMAKNEYGYHVVKGACGITTICRVSDFFVLTDLNDEIIYWRPDVGVVDSLKFPGSGIGQAGECRIQGDRIVYSLFSPEFDDKRLIFYHISDKSLEFNRSFENEAVSYHSRAYQTLVYQLYDFGGDVWGLGHYNSKFWKISGKDISVGGLVLGEGKEMFAADRIKACFAGNCLAEGEKMGLRLRDFLSLVAGWNEQTGHMAGSAGKSGDLSRK